jgi:GDP-L-fucose synthase
MKGQLKKFDLNKNQRILITGITGLVGSQLELNLKERGYNHVFGPKSNELDLTDRYKTLEYFKLHKPDIVFHMAAHVFGIWGNMKNRGDSFVKNVLINTHVLEACKEVGVKKVIAMGTGAVYPFPPISLPLQEDSIWMGPPHPSEHSYAHAKRAMLCHLESYKEDFGLSYSYVISGNLYGPRDKFDPQFGHVTPSLIRKFYEAKRDQTDVSVWGNGSAQRDFMYCYDAAEALIHIAENVEGPINMASGVVRSIKDIVNILGEITGLKEKIAWDTSKPNGQDYRAYDLSLLKQTGFKPKYDLETGLPETYKWFENNYNSFRK